MAKKEKRQKREDKREELERKDDGEREGKASKKPDDAGDEGKPKRKRKTEDQNGKGRRKWPFVVGGVLVVVIGLAAFLLLGKKDKPAPPKAYSGSGGAYTVKYPPDTWQTGEEGRLARRDGAATLTIRAADSVPSDLDDFTRELEPELEERYSDLRRGSANLVSVSAGQAYSYTFTRTRARTEQTVVFVPAGEQGYRLDGVVDAAAQPAATEITQIIRSFALGPQ
jgi:hypothetical protein